MSRGQASFVFFFLKQDKPALSVYICFWTGYRKPTGRQPWATYIFQLELEVPMHYWCGGAQADKVITTLFPAIRCSFSPHDSQAKNLVSRVCLRSLNSEFQTMAAKQCKLQRWPFDRIVAGRF